MKKQTQLGMNPSTASHRLVKDTLWKLVVATGQDKCNRCGQPMTRETFSIEHKIPWLDSDDPVGLFFDQDNIAFSHLRCNIADGRRPLKKYANAEEARQAELKRNREYRRKIYCPVKRAEKYRREGR